MKSKDSAAVVQHPGMVNFRSGNGCPTALPQRYPSRATMLLCEI
jgi:hypothetical protein